MLPKKLFCVDQAPVAAAAFRVARAIVIAADEEAAIGQLQACVDEASRKAAALGKPCPIFLRTKARAVKIADAVSTTPSNTNHGVVCVETTGSATSERKTRALVERSTRR